MNAHIVQKEKEALERRMGAFLQQYRRKAQKRQERNDRQYDRGIEKIVRKLARPQSWTLC